MQSGNLRVILYAKQSTYVHGQPSESFLANGFAGVFVFFCVWDGFESIPPFVCVFLPGAIYTIEG